MGDGEMNGSLSSSDGEPSFLSSKTWGGASEKFRDETGCQLLYSV